MIFEKYNRYEPLKGDFVIMQYSGPDDLKYFLNDNIGQITSIRSHDDICVKYNNVPDI